jgi:hypothetical protein
MFVALWFTSFAFHLNWRLFTMSSMSLSLRSVSKYPRKLLRHVPLRLNPTYRTLSNPFVSWTPRKDSPEEGPLRCTKSYGIITPKKKQLGKQSIEGTKGSRTIFFDEPPRTEMGGSQTCGCLMEEGHAPLDPFCRHRPHPCAGGSAPGGGVLPSAHSCRTN